MKKVTKAEFAREVSVMMRRLSEEAHAMAEGMWNPEFCKSDAAYEATRLCDDLTARIRRFRDKLERSEETPP